ncbi:MAG: hypothetical protein RL695_298 [Pseudomonadota bacterium]|jgi:methyl-accepting chemotaxis protein
MLASIKIGPRLFAAFMLVVAFMVALAGFGYFAMRELAHEFDISVNENNKKLAYAEDMSENLNVVMRSVRNVLLYQDTPNFVRAQQKRIEKARTDYRSSFDEMGKLLRSEDERKAHAEIETHQAPVQKATDDAIALAKPESVTDAAKALKESVQPIQNELHDSIQAMIDLQTKQNNELASHAQASFKRTMIIFGIFTGLAVIFAMGMALWITRSITRPLDYAGGVASAVAAGDLSSTVAAGGADETGLLLRTLRQMKEGLSGLVASVRQAADALSQSSGDLVSSAQAVTDFSSRQSSMAAEAAASLEEITASIETVSHSAQEIRKMAAASQAMTRESSETMYKLTGEIGRLDQTVDAIAESFQKFLESSRSISGLTQQVREIADQTNLLALNAAIEAARAGEQGRGFAVVADEVRKLAEKSGLSVNEIDRVNRTLNEHSGDVILAIRNGQEALGSSKQHVQKTIDALTQADEATCQAAQGVDGIALSVSEQYAASAEISKSVEQMAQLADQNMNAVTRTSDAAVHLQHLAGDLATSMARFKVS